MFLILNVVLYYVGWYLNIHLAAAHHPYWAFLPALICSILQLTYLYLYDNKMFYVDLFLVFYALLFGFLLELLFTQVGVLDYVGAAGSVPLWIVTLYPLFALTVNHSMQWMTRNSWFPLLLGLFAPFIYLAGCKLGACHDPRGFLALALLTIPGWSGLLYLLYLLNIRLKTIVENVFVISSESCPVKMLYDGECPICAKEANWLGKKSSKILFINIADPDYSALANQGIDYDTAMQAMYAIDSKGAVVRGLDAFFNIYAAMGWRFLPVLLQAPLFTQVLALFYRLFAKYRLAITGR